MNQEPPINFRFLNNNGTTPAHPEPLSAPVDGQPEIAVQEEAVEPPAQSALSPDVAQPITEPNPEQSALPTVKEQEALPQDAPVSRHLPTEPLPNAKQHEAYPPRYMVETVTGVRIEPPDCGLLWDEQRQCLYGTPSISGDIRITWLPSGHTSLLYSNSDPRSLWQNIASDENLPYHKADNACLHKPTTQGDLIAARVRGRSHAHVGSCCDDDFSFAYLPAVGDVYLLCVSDGAGSAAYARYGSQLAVHAAKETVERLLLDPQQPYHRLVEMRDEQKKQVAEKLVQNAAYQAFRAHYDAQNDAISLKSLSCTLLMALTLPLSDGQWFTVSYWVGDGAIAVYEPTSQSLALMGAVDSGQYSGETQFLSAKSVSEELTERMRSYISPSMPLLLLMSDGVSDPKFETDAQLANADKWHALWQELQTPLQSALPAQALQDWLGFWSPGNHDDRTLALLLPKALCGGGHE